MIYTIYNPTTYDVLYAQEFEQQPANSTTSILLDSFVKPKYDVQTDTFYEGATPEEIYNADTRNSPDYYIVREQAGKELVRLVSDMLLKDIKSGVRTFDDTMIIEEKLEKTMASLNSGQLLTAKYKINLAQGSIPTDLYSFILTSIDNLCNIHYA